MVYQNGSYIGPCSILVKYIKIRTPNDQINLNSPFRALKVLFEPTLGRSSLLIWVISLFFCFLRGFWDRISSCGCLRLCTGQPQIPCCIWLTDATAKKGGIPGVILRRVWRRWMQSGYPIVRVLLVVLWRPCTWAGMTEGRRMQSPLPSLVVSRFELEIGTSLRIWLA